MKNRFLQSLLSTNFLLLFILSFSISAVAPFITVGTASAATTNYLLKYPDDKSFKKDLKDAFSDKGDIGDDDMNSVFNKMTLYVKNDRINNGEPIQLKINSKLTQKHNLPIFSADYTCYPLEKDPAKRLTTNAPDDSKPYVKTNIGVGLTNNNAWDSIIDDKTVNTYVGSANGDNNNIGKVHFPPSSTTINGAVPHSEAFNIDIPGEGGDNDLRKQVDVAKYHDDETQQNANKASFTDYGSYGGSSQANGDNDVATIGSCLPRPDGQRGKITQVYANLSDDDKKAWDKLTATTSNNDSNDDGTTGTKNGDANVTCETTGFNLSWIMCPIFNGLSDASDFLLKNIIMPLLQTDAICLAPDGDGCKGNNGAIYTIWSNFRIYGNIILVIALLVIVFGESIGGGLVDAYTVKKVLPRLLAAAILINLSLYIVAALIDITNIVGTSIGQIVTAPLSGKDAAFQIKPGGMQLAGAASAGIVGGFLGGASLFALFSSAGAAMLLFVLVIPAMLAILGIFFTIILRNAAITALVILSPVAFALYCLPNTEKYFKKWWDLLTQMLLVYPIIVMVFAVSSVMSVITGGSSSTNPLNAIISFALLIIPLFLIPYAFKLAGSALGQIHGALAGGGARINKMAEGQRERRKERYRGQVVANKVASKDFLQKQQGRFTGDGVGNKLARRALGGAARGIGGYNPEALASATQAATSKELEDQIATGRDEEIRGILVDKKAALAGKDGDLYKTVTNDDGTTKRQFKTLGGAWVDEAAVDAGQRRWGSDRFAKQAALQYEIRKTDGEEDVQQLASRYADVARSTGMTDTELTGAWKGATFANAGQHLALKHMSPTAQAGQMGNDNILDKDGNMVKQGDKSIASENSFVNEVYNKKGTQALSQMHPQTISQLTTAHKNAVLRGDKAAQVKIASIAENFVSRYGAGGGMVPGQDGEDGQEAMLNPQQQAAAAAGRGPVQTNTFGAASVAQNVRELALETGVLQKRPELHESQSTIPYPDIDKPLS